MTIDRPYSQVTEFRFVNDRCRLVPQRPPDQMNYSLSSYCTPLSDLNEI